jgi:hypothetical protein
MSKLDQWDFRWDVSLEDFRRVYQQAERKGPAHGQKTERKIHILFNGDQDEGMQCSICQTDFETLDEAHRHCCEFQTFARRLHLLNDHPDNAGEFTTDECAQLIPLFELAITNMCDNEPVTDLDRRWTSHDSVNWRSMAQTFLAGLRHCVEHGARAVFE